MNEQEIKDAMGKAPEVSPMALDANRKFQENLVALINNHLSLWEDEVRQDVLCSSMTACLVHCFLDIEEAHDRDKDQSLDTIRVALTIREERND